MKKYYNFIILGLLIAILVIVIENKKSKENLTACDVACDTICLGYSDCGGICTLSGGKCGTINPCDGCTCYNKCSY